MASTQKYLGAATPFGKVICIEDRIYNPAVIVEGQDGATKTYTLPFLIARGLTLIENELSTVKLYSQDKPDEPHTLREGEPKT